LITTKSATGDRSVADLNKIVGEVHPFGGKIYYKNTKLLTGEENE